MIIDISTVNFVQYYVNNCGMQMTLQQLDFCSTLENGGIDFANAPTVSILYCKEAVEIPKVAVAKRRLQTELKRRSFL